MKSVRPAKFQENHSNRGARGPSLKESAQSAQTRVDHPEGTRRRDELRPPRDAGQHTGESGGKAQGSPAPRDALGEEPIPLSDQVTGVGCSGSQNHPQTKILHHNWQRVTAQVHRTRPDRTPWAKHHNCRLGWPRATREAPLPTHSGNPCSVSAL